MKKAIKTTPARVVARVIKAVVVRLGVIRVSEGKVNGFLGIRREEV